MCVSVAQIRASVARLRSSLANGSPGVPCRGPGFREPPGAPRGAGAGQDQATVDEGGPRGVTPCVQARLQAGVAPESWPRHDRRGAKHGTNVYKSTRQMPWSHTAGKQQSVSTTHGAHIPKTCPGGMMHACGIQSLHWVQPVGEPASGEVVPAS